MATTKRDKNVAKKLVENLQTDLRSLSAEAKKKHPNIKEVQLIACVCTPISFFKKMAIINRNAFFTLYFH